MSEVSVTPVVKLAVDHVIKCRVLFTSLSSKDPSTIDVLTYASDNGDAEQIKAAAAAIKAHEALTNALKNVDMPKWRIEFANYASAARDEATDNLRKALNAANALAEMHAELQLNQADVDLITETVGDDIGDDSELTPKELRKLWNGRVRAWGIARDMCSEKGNLSDLLKTKYVASHPTDKCPV